MLKNLLALRLQSAQDFPSAVGSKGKSRGSLTKGPTFKATRKSLTFPVGFGPGSLVPEHQPRPAKVTLCAHIQSGCERCGVSHPSARAVDSSLLNAEVQARACHRIPATGAALSQQPAWAALGGAGLRLIEASDPPLTWQQETKRDTRQVCREAEVRGLGRAAHEEEPCRTRKTQEMKPAAQEVAESAQQTAAAVNNSPC